MEMLAIAAGAGSARRILVGLGGVVYGFFTVSGSGIGHHPTTA